MKFTRIPDPVPDMTAWGAEKGRYTFLILQDRESGEVQASIKARGATPFDGGRLDLGAFDSVEDAERACCAWRPS